MALWVLLLFGAGTVGRAEVAALSVDAGADQEFASKSRPLLQGTVTIPAGSGGAPLSTEWRLVSGPAEVRFAHETALETEVDFTVPGTYVFRLTATQDAASAEDEVTIVYTDRETSLSLRDFRSPDPGRVSYLTPADYDIRLVSFSGDALTVKCDKRLPSWFYDENEHYVLVFSRLNAKGPFTTGDYVDDDYEHYMAVTHDGSFAHAEGVFTISQLEVDDNGHLTALRLSFSQFSLDSQGNRTPPLQGELRWRTDVSKVPANRAPVVHAGPPIFLSGRTSTAMAAVIEDDGLPVANPISLRWTPVSGPGTPQIYGNEPFTTVFFPQPGTYVLRYSASDGDLTTSDEVTVVVGTGTQSYRGYLTHNNVIGGSLQVQVLATGRFTASMVLGGTRSIFAGAFVNGQFTRTVPDKKGPIVYRLAQSASSGAISGTITQGDFVLTLFAEQTSEPFLRISKQASPYAGAYTWQTALPAPGKGPLGHNYGTAVVKPNGSCVIAGHLADGQVVSYGGWLGLDGVVPLIAMYGATEVFSGPVKFVSTPINGLSMAASLQWVRKPNPKDPRFPTGIVALSQLAGARYTAPTPLLNLLTLQSAGVDVKIQSFAASWGTPRPDARTLQPRGVVTGASAGFQLSTDPRTGLFSGTVLDPLKKARRFGGAFIQGFGVGGGTFLGDHETGVIELEVTPP